MPSSLSYETKLKFVEIVMIFVSDLTPILHILVVIIISYLQCVRSGEKRILFMLVTYIRKKNTAFINGLPGSKIV